MYLVGTPPPGLYLVISNGAEITDHGYDPNACFNVPEPHHKPKLPNSELPEVHTAAENRENGIAM